MTKTSDKLRIAKFLANAGIGSRRDAEAMILAGRVQVNGQTLQTPVHFMADGDEVKVDGQPVTGESSRPRMWCYYKPEGLVTTHKDPQGRPTVFERLPEDFPRVISIGRLDLSSEGLLLLTTSGAIARHLELPATGWVRSYRVRIYGIPTEDELEKIRAGLTIDGVSYLGCDVAIDHQAAHNAWLTMKIKEGKNREIRRIMEHFGWRVGRLIRIGYGPFQLGQLQPGAVREIPYKTLKEQLGTLVMGGFATSQASEDGAAKPIRERRSAPLRPTPLRSSARRTTEEGFTVKRSTEGPTPRRPAPSRATGTKSTTWESAPAESARSSSRPPARSAARKGTRRVTDQRVMEEMGRDGPRQSPTARRAPRWVSGSDTAAPSRPTLGLTTDRPTRSPTKPQGARRFADRRTPDESADATTRPAYKSSDRSFADRRPSDRPTKPRRFTDERGEGASSQSPTARRAPRRGTDERFADQRVSQATGERTEGRPAYKSSDKSFRSSTRTEGRSSSQSSGRPSGRSWDKSSDRPSRPAAGRPTSSRSSSDRSASDRPAGRSWEKPSDKAPGQSRSSERSPRKFFGRPTTDGVASDTGTARRRPARDDTRARPAQPSDTSSRSTGRSSSKPWDKTSDKPSGRSWDKSSDKPRSSGRSTGRASGKPLGESQGKPFSRPSGRPTGKPSGKPTRR